MLSKLQDKYKRVLIDKDIKIDSMIASKDTDRQALAGFAIFEKIFERSRRRHCMSPVCSSPVTARFEG